MSEGGLDISSQIDVEWVDRTPGDHSAETKSLLDGRQILPLGEAEPDYRRLVFLGEAFDQMIGYGNSNRGRELGGALFGYHDDNSGETIITRFIASTDAQSTWGEINFHATDWAHLLTTNDALNNSEGTDHKMVAWFHTHPHDYPPMPLTSGDRQIMRDHFAEHDGPDDTTTLIMTTVPSIQGGPENEIVLAAWKWDKERGEARLMRGAQVARKPNSPSAEVTYFDPPIEAGRVVKDKLTETITIELEDLTVIQNTVSDQIELDDETITIDLDVPEEDGIEIEHVVFNPTSGTIEINLDEVTPERAKKLIQLIQKRPYGKYHSIFKGILQQAKKVMPQGLQNEIDLVLIQTPTVLEQIEISPSLEDQIEIIPEES